MDKFQMIIYFEQKINNKFIMTVHYLQLTTTLNLQPIYLQTKRLKQLQLLLRFRFVQ
jgi:hypothetical protein